MTRVTILSRSDCHLCTVVDKLARRLAEDLELVIDRQDVDSRPQWQEQYGSLIPVVLVDNIEACRGKVTETELRRAIERAKKSARWRRPISRILSRLGMMPRQG